MPNQPSNHGGRRTGVGVGSVLFLSLCTSSGASAAAETYEKTSIDQNRHVRIVTTNGREIVPKFDEDQVDVGDPVISPNRRAVGWLAQYPNCCTSYPIPLKLMVYSDGKLHAFTGVELPVWKWRFEAGGKQVVVEQETVHGGIGIHYELRNIKNGKLISQWEPGDPEKPKWVERLDSEP